MHAMKLEHLISKLEQIKEQARLTLEEYPRGHTIERQRLILALAWQLRSHLSDQQRHAERELAGEPPQAGQPGLAGGEEVEPRPEGS